MHTYEDIDLRAYENGRELQAGLTRYCDPCRGSQISRPACGYLEGRPAPIGHER